MTVTDTQKVDRSYYVWNRVTDCAKIKKKCSPTVKFSWTYSPIREREKEKNCIDLILYNTTTTVIQAIYLCKNRLKNPLDRSYNLHKSHRYYKHIFGLNLQLTQFCYSTEFLSSPYQLVKFLKYSHLVSKLPIFILNTVVMNQIGLNFKLHCTSIVDNWIIC